jgi:hypothetical protein
MPPAKCGRSWKFALSAATITLASSAISECTWARHSIAAISGTRMLAMFFDNLGAFAVNLAPDAGIGDVAEG